MLAKIKAIFSAVKVTKNVIIKQTVDISSSISRVDEGSDTDDFKRLL